MLGEPNKQESVHYWLMSLNSAVQTFLTFTSRFGKIQESIMRNHTTVTVFILLGLTEDPQLQVLLFIFLFLTYILSITGNLTTSYCSFGLQPQSGFWGYPF